VNLPRNTILIGDAATRLCELPAASVDCVITSPPYFGLRDYGAEGQLGLEDSVQEWVANLLPVLDELGRALKPEGSVWLNLGDSYSRHPKYGAPTKSFTLGPERLLLALLERGWIVRNKVVWAKPNPMPTSVRDRLTAGWEPMYFLVRSRRYFFDLDAVRIPHRSQPSQSANAADAGWRSAWAGPLASPRAGLAELKRSGAPGHPLGKNPGDVWLISTSSFRGGHRATFPESLVERPVLATCPERTCLTCGRAWGREQVARAVGRLAVIGQLRPACSCGAGWRPGVVLDPFIGSGTTAVVAERLGRDWLGIELRPSSRPRPNGVSVQPGPYHRARRRDPPRR
jgi:DNA modification methylase